MLPHQIVFLLTVLMYSRISRVECSDVNVTQYKPVNEEYIRTIGRLPCTVYDSRGLGGNKLWSCAQRFFYPRLALLFGRNVTHCVVCTGQEGALVDLAQFNVEWMARVGKLNAVTISLY